MCTKRDPRCGADKVQDRARQSQTCAIRSTKTKRAKKVLCWRNHGRVRMKEKVDISQDLHIEGIWFRTAYYK